MKPAFGRSFEEQNMIVFIKTWLELKTDKRAVTALEYGLIAALISVVCITVLTNVGTKLKGKFSSVSNALN